MASLERTIELSDAHDLRARVDVPRVAPQRRRSSSSLAPRLPGIALLGLFFATWEIAPRMGWTPPAFLPALSEVLRSGLALAQDGQLFTHVTNSVSRALVGFSLAIVIGVPLGLCMGWFRRLSDALHPLLEFFRCTPALALLPVFILLLGIGESSKIALVLYSCAWPILLNTVAAVRGVDPLLIKCARSLGLSTFQILWKVVLPAAVPTIFVGFRLAGAISLVALVAAEMLGAKAGLGYLIQYSQYNFQIPQMYAGILGIALLGVSFTQALAALERRFSRWKPRPESGTGA
jgi:NitT/TauT family transport system permease protein